MNKFDQGLRFVRNPTKSTKRRPLQNPYSYVIRMYPYVTRMYPYVPVCSVCYDIFYTNNPRIPTNYLKEMLRLILQENSFQFIGQGWRSGESARLPPMWPGFDSRARRHMWVEFVVSSRPCS